jgi:hypothetical protein
MCFQIRVARVQKVVRDVLLQWEPLLLFVHERRVLLGIPEQESTSSFIHRVRTACVWTQGLTEDHFIDEVTANDDLILRVAQQIIQLKTILETLISLRSSVEPNEEKLTTKVLDVYKVIFPIDRKNQFSLLNEGAMYQTLRSTRLSSSQQQTRSPWPVVRPDSSNIANLVDHM